MADLTPSGSGRPPAPSETDRSRTLVIERLQPLLILIAVIALMTVLSPKFFSVNNLMTIGVQGTVQAILAIGVTLVIISGGIDLSIGTLMSLTMVVMGTLVINLGLPLELGIVCAILTGALVGFVNGGLIAYTALPPFIVTLGMLGIAQGLALTISDGYSMYGFPDYFQDIAWSSFAGVPIPLFILAALALAAVFVFGQTRLGRYAYTIGGNEEAVRRSGVDVKLHKTFIYVFAGVMSGIASVVLASRVNSAQPGVGFGFELDAIAAAVIGGASLMGGRGTVLGAIIGAMTMASIRFGLNVMGMSPFIQQIVVGCILIAAVLLDTLRTSDQLKWPDFLRRDGRGGD